MSGQFNQYVASVVIAATVVGGLSGCATYRNCGFAGCAGDARITVGIEQRLRENAAIEDWGIKVQTLDRVVYLYGIVDTIVERNFIETTARETPGVVRVVDSIELRGDAW